MLVEKCHLQWGLKLEPIVIHSDDYLTEVTWYCFRATSGGGGGQWILVSLHKLISSQNLDPSAITFSFISLIFENTFSSLSI